MRSIRSFIFLVIIGVSSCISEDTSSCGPSNKLNWSEQPELTVAEFPKNSNPENDFDAYTSTLICYSYTSAPVMGGRPMVTTNVINYFLLEESWSKTGEITPALLNHEQGHFDISEIHARILRFEYEHFTFTDNFDYELDSIFVAVMDIRDQMEQNYDAATNHSLNVLGQEDWNNRIALKLSELEAYK